jgi:hypothetical protein
MADFFHVSADTIAEWKKVHKEFSESITRGREYADANVASRLYERAMGYSHPDVHVSNYQGEITLTPLVKHYPPDTQAASLWLRNRQPHKWRDKTEHEHTHKREISELTDAELLAIAGRAGTTEQTDSSDKPPQVH